MQHFPGAPTRHPLLIFIGALATLIGAGAILVPQRALALEPPPEDSYEVLTRGPVHEAFAESVSFEPEPGIIVAAAPPEPIEELPPEVQPEGDNVEWIPGYWAWDDEQDDYLWISGVWRNLPPGRQWVPGYWNSLATDDWQWVSGYWADAEVEEVAYISTAPPQTVEVGPSVAAPSVDHSWIPGVWIWATTRYVWRPGYWSPLRSGWTWVPARYCWTPRGYVFIDGYWDHAVGTRGVVFAPLHVRHDRWSHRRHFYRPSVVVALDVFTDHLFYRDRTCHYYFGDYYAPRYRDRGYRPYWARHARRGCYEPIYAHQRWVHRADRRWEERLRQGYGFRRDHRDARPPRTWSAMRRLEAGREAAGQRRVFASTLGDFRRQQGERMRFRKLEQDRLERIVDQRRRTREFSQQRQRLENLATARQDASKRGAEAMKQRLARSPIAGRSGNRLGKAARPPERIEPNAARLQREAGERLKRSAQVRSNPGRERPAAPGRASRPSATERLEAARETQQERLRDARQRATERQQARGGNARGGQANPQARQSQRNRQAQAQAQAQAQQQARERSQAQQQQRSRSAQPQAQARQARERAQAQQQERARQAQERARVQQQQRSRSAQPQAQARQARERAQAQQQERARQAQERARAQQQQRSRSAQPQAQARQARERAQAQQQQRARQARERAQAQQQQRARQARDRAQAQQQQRARQARERAQAQQQRARQQQQQRQQQLRERARNPRKGR